MTIQFNNAEEEAAYLRAQVTRLTQENERLVREHLEYSLRAGAQVHSLTQERDKARKAMLEIGAELTLGGQTIFQIKAEHDRLRAALEKIADPKGAEVKASGKSVLGYVRGIARAALQGTEATEETT